MGASLAQARREGSWERKSSAMSAKTATRPALTVEDGGERRATRRREGRTSSVVGRQEESTPRTMRVAPPRAPAESSSAAPYVAAVFFR